MNTYHVLIGGHELTVHAASEWDAIFQAGITLALGRPASQIRRLKVTAVRCEASVAS